MIHGEKAKNSLLLQKGNADIRKYYKGRKSSGDISSTFIAANKLM